ncbi:MAG: hypothetical protein ACYTEZ_06805 [Planctomycetota bacterium]|jgi:hypothetical protein
MKRLALIFLLTAGLGHAQDEPKVWVHAPAEDLLALFPEKGAGFLISIEEYRKLLDLARAGEAAAKERPPLAGRLVRGTATAAVKDDVLEVDAAFVAVVKGERPVTIPFPLHGIALREITVEGGELAGDALRFDQPGTYAVRAKLSARLHREGDLRRAAFRLPPAAAHTLTLTLPPEVEGEVGPIVRAFRSGDEGGRVVGYPDERGLFKLWYKPRAPARRLDAILSVAFDAVAEIGEARTTTRTALDLEVLRAPVDRLDLLLAPGQTIRALTGKGVKSWRLVRGTPDRLEIRFVEPLQRLVALSLETELPREEAEQVAIPIPRLPGAVRYRGTVGIVARPEVRLTGLRAEGARRLDRTPKGGIALYEVWSQEGRLHATVARVAQKTQARTRALLLFREGGKSLVLRFEYAITGRPLFRLAPGLPRGWILRHARLDGRDVAHTSSYEEDGRLVMDFPAGLKPGAHALDLLLDTDEVDWVPGEGAVTFELAGLRSGLDEERGLLVVASDPAFRVGEGATNGLEPVGMPEVARALGRVSDRMLFAWRFDRPDYAARFTLERHQPQITATVINRLLPSERLLKVHATLLVDIQRTGVRELEVVLPPGTGKLVEFTGPLIKEKRAPAGEGADTETWTIVFQKRVRGTYRLDVTFDRRFEADAWTADAPAIRVPGAQERGFVVVHSSGTTAIAVERNGLREADVGELPEPPTRPPLEVLAYARHPYRVTVSSRRHDPEPVVQAIALSADVYGVLSHEGHLRCRAEYRVRNNDQPFLRFALPEGSRLVGVLVDGEPKKPLVARGRLQLALPRSKNRVTPFVVAIIYESEVEALERTGRLTVDRPALDIDVLETRYTLHLPRGYALTGHDGDLVPLDLAERTSVLEDLVARLPSLPVLVPKVAGEEDRLIPTSGVVVESEVGIGGGAAADDRGVASRERELEKKLRNAEFWLSQYRMRYGDVTAGSDKAEKGADAGPATTEKLKEVSVLLALVEKDAAKKADRKTVLRAKALQDELRKELEEAKRAPKPSRSAGREVRKPPAPGGAVPPGQREPEDSEPPATPPSDPGAADGPTTMTATGKFVAHGGKGRPTGPARPTPPPKRQRPERALLSLDVQFLRPDNLYRLDSLAPTGRVTLSYARAEVYDRHHFLGVVLGAAAALAFLLGGRRAWLRLIPAAVLVVLALHFAGLSFLPADFARGAGQSVALLLVLFVVVRLAWACGRLGRKLFRRKAAPVASLLLLCAMAEAGDEVLVPYREDPEEMGEITRVFLPADEYHRLRRLAYPETASRATALARAEYEAQLSGEELTVRARYEIVKETEEAERLPLGLDDVAVTSARLDGRPANLAIEKKRYVLVLEGQGRFRLELELRPRLEARGETRTFRFPVRPVAEARLRLTHDREGHEVHVVGVGGREADLHHIGPVGILGATWTPKTEGFTAEAAELRARTELMVSVRDGFTAVAGRIVYGVSGGTVERLRVRVGRDLTVRQVRCPDLAGWQVDDGNLVVALAKPADKGLTLELLAERPAQRERTETVPEIAPLDVLRDAGVLALETLPDLKIEVLESQGLLRGLARQAPQKLSAAPDRGALHSVYRFAVRPYQLRWRVFLERTRLRSETHLDLFVEREAVLADARVKVEVERGAGPFSIPVAVPAGYTVAAVRGPVRDWWVRDDTLTIDRPTRQTGTQEYRILLRRRGATSDPVTAPALAVVGAVRETGLVRIAVADGLELETGETTGLLPEDVAKVGRAPRGRLLRAYRYFTTPWRLILSTREEKRETEALVVSRVLPLADRILVEAVIDFHVRRGLVDRLSFVVPVEEEGATLINAADKREVRSEPVDGGRRFTVWLRTPTRGSTSVTVGYSLAYDDAVRGVEPEDVARVRRYVAVEKVPDGEVRVVEAANLDAGEFEDLPLHPPETTAQSVARVLVGSGEPFVLSLAVKRHTFEEVARAVVYRAGAQAVVDRSGWVRVLVSYRVYNRSEQFLRVALPAGARLYSVLVAGEGVRPLGEGRDLLVPLRKLALGAPTFDVDVFYAYAGPRVGEADFQTRLPEVKGLDVRRTTLSLYVPADFSYSFETEMEEVEEADLAAGEATDLYEEIKELYGVVQRGNRLQAGRAFGNVQQLEQKAQRLMDYLGANTRDEATLQQIDSQRRALDALKRASKAPAPQAPEQAGGFQAGEAQKARGAYEWEVNRAFLERSRDADRQQVEGYLSKQQAHEAPREERQTAQVGEGWESADAEEDVDGRGRVDFGAAELRRQVQGVQVDVDSYLRDATREQLRSATYAPPKLRAATGRISLRIDLPRKGEVYHFAYLGREGGVTFDASAKDRSLLHGLLALVCAAGVVFVLRYKAGR